MRIIKRIIITFVILFFAIAILPWFVFPVLNDIKASYLKHELQKEPLPQETAIIEALSGSGNTGGTGNHTEIWAGILIKTRLPEEKINQFYGGNVQKVDASKKGTFIMDLLSEQFSSLRSVSDYDGYYIVERVDNAVSSLFDLRGH